MKTTSTQIRNFILATVLTLSATSVFSQTTTPSDKDMISNLKANVINNSLVIDWNLSDDMSANICEVQASKDGKTFTTIGLVMGANPAQTGSNYMFKQNMKNIKTGMVYYRVVTVANGQNASSNVVKSLI